MVFARHIPTLMAIGAVLAAYRLLGVGDLFKELIKKDLQPAYDYVIGWLSLYYICVTALHLCVLPFAWCSETNKLKCRAYYF